MSAPSTPVPAPKYPKVKGYTIVEEIGTGGFSSVFRATNFDEGRVAALKVVFINERTTERERKALDREMRIHGALDNEYIINFMDAVIVENSNRPQKYIPGVYMLLELAGGGDLFDKIVPNVGIDSDTAQHYFVQLAAGIRHIHEQGVVHRDLKPENILLDAGGTLKVSDFGLAAVWHIQASGKTRQLTDVCGSLPYIAPELGLGKPYHAPPIDIWGLGVILFTLLVGNTPWDEPSGRSPEFAAYMAGDFQSDDPWNRIGGTELGLILGMLTADPNRRLTLDQIFAHPWIQQPSQVGRMGSAAIADRLTQNLRAAGDMDVANPMDMPLDGDGDVHMLTAPQTMSQFTASLMLFSQTQSGRRYNPHLTRFYAAPASADIYALVRTALVALKVQTRVQPAAPDGAPAWENGQLKLRVGGKDARQEAFRGWIVVEPARWNNTDIACVIFQRDQGNPISWRQLWKATTQHPTIWPHVLHRGRTMPNRTVTQEEPTPYADTTVTLSKPPVPPLDITQKELELHPSWPHMN